ncbi:MAG: hypothetical protein MUO21_11455 [Nitrososphaeraceae archaeon]|nr:hypothetical protein [Nitrososphaeraceae archaeon]
MTTIDLVPVVINGEQYIKITSQEMLDIIVKKMQPKRKYLVETQKQ